MAVNVFRSGLFIISLTLLTRMSGLAQTEKWDSTYRPEVYPSRVAMFRSFKHSPEDIVFVGNSLTFWAEWRELLGNENIRNRGIPGDITFGVLERLDEVVDGQPEKVFILIGINDIARNIPDSVIVDNYKRMIRLIKKGSPRTEIIFQTLLPTNSSFNKLREHYRNERVEGLNATIRLLSVEEDITLLDLHPHFEDGEGNLIAEFTFDGVHLNMKGYSKWKQILEDGNYLH